MKKTIFIMLIISFIIAGIVSWFASPAPDGLEKVASDKGFIEKVVEPAYKIFPDYTIPGLNKFLSNCVAGIMGTIVTFLLVILIGKAVSRRKNHKDSDSSYRC
jgi:cobalt/nickel transport protein